MVRQERIGLHMCDAIAKITLGRQDRRLRRCSTGRAPRTPLAASRSPMAIPARSSCCRPAMPATSTRSTRTSTPRSTSATSPRWSEQVTVADATVEAHAPRLHDRSRTAGRARCWSSSRPTSCATRSASLVDEYKPAPRLKSGPDPKSVSQIAEALVAAERPVIYAGQGVHYAKAWPQLKALAELLEARS